MHLAERSLVRMTCNAKKWYELEYADDRLTVEQKELFEERYFIFLGMIPNMPDHCIVVGFDSGKIFSGYDKDNFEYVPEEEV